MKVIFGTFLLCALTSNVAAAQDAVDAKGGQARVRFFGQAALAIQFHKNQTCIGKRGIPVSKSNLGALFGSSKSISLGMPETPNVTNLRKRDGFLMPAFYREYAVRANEPIAIAAQFHETTEDPEFSVGSISYTRPGSARGCTRVGATFTPEEGNDYEVTFDIGSSSCALKVVQVQVKNAALLLDPVATAEAHKCTAQDVLPIAVCKAAMAECKEGIVEKFRDTAPQGKPDKAAFAGCAAEYKACAAATK